MKLVRENINFEKPESEEDFKDKLFSLKAGDKFKIKNSEDKYVIVTAQSDEYINILPSGEKYKRIHFKYEDGWDEWETWHAIREINGREWKII